MGGMAVNRDTVNKSETMTRHRLAERLRITHSRSSTRPSPMGMLMGWDLLGMTRFACLLTNLTEIAQSCTYMERSGFGKVLRTSPRSP